MNESGSISLLEARRPERHMCKESSSQCRMHLGHLGQLNQKVPPVPCATVPSNAKVPSDLLRQWSESSRETSHQACERVRLSTID